MCDWRGWHQIQMVPIGARIGCVIGAEIIGCVIVNNWVCDWPPSDEQFTYLLRVRCPVLCLMMFQFDVGLLLFWLIRGLIWAYC